MVSSGINPLLDLSLYGDSAASARRGDGSFDTQLETAQKELEHKSKLSSFPWSQLESLFDILPLEFDFDFQASQIQESPSQPKEETNTRPDQEAKPQALTAKAEVVKVCSDVKIIKEVLSKNIPAPQVLFAPIVPGQNISGQMTSSPVSRIDLQKLIDEIIKNAELIKSGKKTELKLGILEQELGEMELAFSVKSGVVSVMISTRNEETKKIITDNITELEIALKDAKIRLEDIKVMEVKDERHSRYPA